MFDVEPSMTIEDFKDLILKSLFEDESTRHMTCAELLWGDERLPGAAAVAHVADGPLLVVFSTRCLECRCQEEAPYGLRHEERGVALQIPSSCTEVPRGAFVGCSSIRSLTIPESVKRIEAFAFYGCSSLTSRLSRK